MKKTITTEFFTTISLKHFFTSLFYLTFGLPFLRKGANVEKLEEKMLEFLGEGKKGVSGASSLPGGENGERDNKERIRGGSKIISFYNGRTALFQALKMIGIRSGDEIIVNSYTCVSVVNPIIQAKGTPIYVDIDEKNLSFNVENLKKKITKNTKVIILQHTFGKTGPILEILKIAKEKNILVIEDCAHSLGSILEGKKHGTFGDFAIFSTGRDKVISSVNGGFLLINNEKFFPKIGEIEKNLILVPRKIVFKNLFYNISGYLAYKTYDFFSLGKGIIHFSRKFGLINEILLPGEKQCKNEDLNYKLPNSLAKLALNDLKNIKEYTEHRKKIAKYYDENLKFEDFKNILKDEANVRNDYYRSDDENVRNDYHRSNDDDYRSNEEMNYFRYPIVFKNEDLAEKYYKYLRKNGILLGNSWSSINIVPKGTSLDCAKYKFDCKLAENISKTILLLPNHKFINLKDAEKVVKLMNVKNNKA